MTFRLAPFALLVFPSVDAVNFGLNASPAQPPTWNRLDTGAVAPSLPETVPVIAIGLQFVGLNMNPGRSITALTVRISVGTPSMICGSGSVVTVTCGD